MKGGIEVISLRPFCTKCKQENLTKYTFLKSSGNGKIEYTCVRCGHKFNVIMYIEDSDD